MYKSTKITHGGADSFPLFVGRNHIELHDVDSTNQYAAYLLSKSKPPEGTVISAVNQHKGKGQIGNNWQSEPGKNLVISYIFYPHFLLIRQQFYFNLAIALACRATVQNFVSQSVKIKWPNDIYIDERKIGGILIQNNLQAQQINSSVVGIGINVNQTNFNNLPNPTSIFLESEKENDCSQILKVLNTETEKRYLLLKQGKLKSISSEYYQHLYLLNQPAIFIENNGHQFKGSIVGVSIDGKLEVQRDGNIHHFRVQEIKFKRL